MYNFVEATMGSGIKINKSNLPKGEKMKKLFLTLVVTGILAVCFTGCNKVSSTADNSEDTSSIDETVVEDMEDVEEAEDDSIVEDVEDVGDAGIQVTTVAVCSLCEVEKECGTYGVDGKDYIVCDSCYTEFATGMQLFDPHANHECSLCEVEKICSIYAVKGEGYIVCDDCYNEFATAFDLEKGEE